MLGDGTEIEPEESEAKSIHTKIFLIGIFFAAYWAIGSTIQNEDHGVPLIVSTGAASLLIVSMCYILVIFIHIGKLVLKFYLDTNRIPLPWDRIDSFFTNDESENNSFEIVNVGLVEPRSVRQSIGIGAGKGGIGIGTSRSYFAGNEQTKIDSGTVVFDSSKIQFIGTTKQMSWVWNKLISVNIEYGLISGNIFMVVSSRKNISGLMISADESEIQKLGNYIIDYANIDSEE